MSITETKVTLTTRRDWVNRFMKKNTKEEMASALADVRKLYESVTDPEIEDALEKILFKVTW